eukprot:CAMPEP_0170484464 /NCGR_PEP_ID=MMETSP0208-20121228/3934_1 /TAXON_ID=197538 /ORGANISM="Strombidium inclinatum, Strain S3" /LENGTH=171 /DNA_ID=CAMNT_0010757803 /DNA_START=385 /DNA_END=900 /DNA_ORIENTATION=+
MSATASASPPLTSKETPPSGLFEKPSDALLCSDSRPCKVGGAESTSDERGNSKDTLNLLTKGNKDYQVNSLGPLSNAVTVVSSSNLSALVSADSSPQLPPSSDKQRCKFENNHPNGPNGDLRSGNGEPGGVSIPSPYNTTLSIDPLSPLLFDGASRLVKHNSFHQLSEAPL